MRYGAILIPLIFEITAYYTKHVTTNSMLLFWTAMGIVYALIYVGDCIKEKK